MNIDGSSVVPTHPSNVEFEQLGDQIAELAAHLDAATARLLELIRDFDARGGWGNGFRSCAHWLAWRVGLQLGAAREQVRVARALGSLPRLSQAFARGELSYSKVRALTRVATPETEERLLAVGRAGTAEHVELIVRGWRRMDRKAEAQEATRRRHRALHVYQDADGMVVIRGRLEPEVGAVVMQALAAARDLLYRRRKAKDVPAGTRPLDVPAGTSVVDGSPEAPTMEQQQADALALVAEAALHHGINPGAPGERYEVVVSRRCGGAGRCRGAGPVGARRRRARSGGNVAAVGVRRQSCRDAARRGGPNQRGWRANAHDSACVAACAAASRQRLPVPRLWPALRRGPSH
jgi:Domain of unknown function (DUF222)